MHALNGLASLDTKCLENFNMVTLEKAANIREAENK